MRARVWFREDGKERGDMRKGLGFRNKPHDQAWMEVKRRGRRRKDRERERDRCDVVFL